MKQAIPDLWQENGTLSIINQTGIMMKKTRLSITQKYLNPVFVFTMMHTF